MSQAVNQSNGRKKSSQQNAKADAAKAVVIENEEMEMDVLPGATDMKCIDELITLGKKMLDEQIEHMKERNAMRRKLNRSSKALKAAFEDYNDLCDRQLDKRVDRLHSFVKQAKKHRKLTEKVIRMHKVPEASSEKNIIKD